MDTMKKTTLFILFISFTFWCFPTYGKSRIASVPFQVVGTYVVVEVTINGSSKLNLILDSGLSATLITELRAEDSLTLNYSSEYEIKGLGPGTGIMSYRSINNTIKAGKINIPNSQVFVLRENIFNLSNHVGSKINGILGADFFEGRVVKINYNTHYITFYDAKTFEVPKGYSPIQMIIEGHKMFVSLPVADVDWSVKNAIMLLDTGAEVSAWFRSFGNAPFQIPSKKMHGYIGQGLNGMIEGYMGRVNQINMGGNILRNPIVSFPDSISIAEAISASERDGTIGAQLLNRFNLIFDQSRKMLYVKPNVNFKKPFSYNIAGIELIIENKLFALPEVCNVRKDSPAELAGVQVGDMIFQINELSGLKTNINEMKKIFELSNRKFLYLTVLRGSKTIDFKIEMKGVL